MVYVGEACGVADFHRRASPESPEEGAGADGEAEGAERRSSRRRRKEEEQKIGRKRKLSCQLVRRRRAFIPLYVCIALCVLHCIYVCRTVFDFEVLKFVKSI